MKIDVREHGYTIYDGLAVIDVDSGFKIARVVACDDEAGWVMVHRMSADGHVLRDPDTQEMILTKLYRRVKILKKADIPNIHRIGVVSLGMLYD